MADTDPSSPNPPFPQPPHSSSPSRPAEPARLPLMGQSFRSQPFAHGSPPPRAAGSSNSKRTLWIVLGALAAMVSVCGGAVFLVTQAGKRFGEQIRERDAARRKGGVAAGGIGPGAAAEGVGDAAEMVAAPTGRLVLEQKLEFTDGTESEAGMAFLALTPGGQVVGVTSAHIFESEQPGEPATRRVTIMLDSEWAEILAKRSVENITPPTVVATGVESFGKMGQGGTDNPKTLDLRRDYLMVKFTQTLVPGPDGTIEVADKGGKVQVRVLEMDRRERPRVGERVWLPVYDFFEPKNGQRLVGGTVDEVSIKMSSIVLDENIELRGRSGSPLISQSTGKVIGTLSRGGTIDGKAYILIAPSAGILRGMRDAETMRVMPRLEEETRGK